MLAKVASLYPTRAFHENIIILCDGTGNAISENISNAFKFCSCLRKTGKSKPRQMVSSDPGVGTLARPDTWHGLAQIFPPFWASPTAINY